MKNLIMCLCVCIMACGSEPPAPNNALQTIPNGPNSPCGKIIDMEPYPYGWACCENEPNSEGYDMIYYKYWDGTTTTDLCQGKCVSGACQF